MTWTARSIKGGISVNMIKKTVGFVLAVLLAASLLPGTAGAEDSIVVLSENLNLTNVSYGYEAGSHVIFKDGIGEQRFRATVTGPSTLKYIGISEWSDGYNDSADWIRENAKNAISFWKEDGLSNYTNTVQAIPYQLDDRISAASESELGQTRYVTFLGLDTNGDLIGFAVVKTVMGQSYTPSGSSGGGGTNKLAAPSNLHWETASRQCEETWNGKTRTVDVFPGWFSWDASSSDTGAERLLYDINMYCGEEKVGHHTWSAAGSRDSFHIGVFLTKPHESGQYRFSIQLIDRNDRSRDSDLVWSDVWSYTNPGVSLPVPEDLSAEGAVVSWTASGKSAAEWYYSTEENGAEEYSLSYWSLTSPLDLSVETDDFQYGDGYYHVRVKDLGNDITQICPSEWSDYLTVHVVNGAVVSGGGGGSGDATNIVASGYCGGEGDGTNLTWTLDKDGVLIISGSGTMQEFESPNGPIATPWTNDKNSIKCVIIGENVTTVGTAAFMHCENLTEVELPATLTKINQWAFDSCQSLPSITIPAQVAYINVEAFSNCSNLERIEVSSANNTFFSEDGVLFKRSPGTIVAYPAGNTNSSYTVLDTVSTIGRGAFEGCVNLKRVVIPQGVKEIPYRAFYECTALETIQIPSSVTSIGNSAFSFCSSLTSVFMPDSISNIGKQAFLVCNSLTDVYYRGSEAQWNKIQIVSYHNDPLTSDTVTIHYFSGSTPFTVTDEGTRADPATNEEIQYETRSDNSVAVSGDVSAAAPVLVATYDQNGKMTGLTQLTEPGRADLSAGDTAKLFWLGNGSAPKCDCLPIG